MKGWLILENWNLPGCVPKKAACSAERCSCRSDGNIRTDNCFYHHVLETVVQLEKLDCFSTGKYLLEW